MPPEARVDEYVRLLSQHQRRLAMYICTLVPTWNDAEEIIQETSLVLWREFDRFEPGTNFLAWACRIAFHQVLAWRKKRTRDRLEFSPEFLERVAEEAIQSQDWLEERREALSACLERLPDAQRELLRLRYSEDCTVETLADRLQRTSTALYRALSRIRQTLTECVQRRLAKAVAE